jgi:thiol-disulfide isomerase/thioredoxin
MKYLTSLPIVLVLLIACLGCEPPSYPVDPVPPTPAAYTWLEPGRHVVAFTSDHCKPCQEQKSEFRAIASHGVTTHEVDVDASPDIAREYGVRRLPTYVVFENGAEIERHESVTALLIALKALVWVLSIFLL